MLFYPLILTNSNILASIKFIIVAVLVLIILGSSLYFGIRHFNTSYERRNGYYVESIKAISSPAPTASPDTEPTPLEIIN